MVDFKITRRIGVLGERKDGWTKEINMVSWNGKKPKYDIRSWDSAHTKMTKGITLAENEVDCLKRALALSSDREQLLQEALSWIFEHLGGDGKEYLRVLCEYLGAPKDMAIEEGENLGFTEEEIMETVGEYLE